MNDKLILTIPGKLRDDIVTFIRHHDNVNGVVGRNIINALQSLPEQRVSMPGMPTLENLYDIVADYKGDPRIAKDILAIIPAQGEGWTVALGQCQGCGAILQPKEIEAYGSGFCHVLAECCRNTDEGGGCCGSPDPAPCGPVRRFADMDAPPRQTEEKES